ncbi:MAG TPA: hypothetical protein VJ302_27875 [Blastocatellia bacterium]|nr:hypothetical protein [Blastocatellia bacterium]
MNRAWVKWTMAAMVMMVIIPMTGMAHGRRDRDRGYRDYRGGSINERQREQEVRIRQGVRSGELTRREARRLQEQQDRIRRDEFRARRSGGEFTPSERARIQRELNESNRDIRREKNDRQDRW